MLLLLFFLFLFFSLDLFVFFFAFYLSLGHIVTESIAGVAMDMIRYHS